MPSQVDFLIASLGERGFILGTFNPHLPLTQNGLIPCLQFLQGGQGELEVGRLQGLQHFFGDGGIEPIATEAHTIPARQAFAA